MAPESLARSESDPLGPGSEVSENDVRGDVRIPRPDFPVVPFSRANGSIPIPDPLPLLVEPVPVPPEIRPPVTPK